MNTDITAHTKAEITSPNGHKARTAAAIILAFAGITGSVQLLRLQTIGEATFVSLIAVFSVVGVVIAFIDRVSSFGSPAFKVEMARVEEARREVEKREKRVADIARILSEIGDWNIEKHGILFGSDSIEKNKQWLVQKNAELKALIEEKT